ncbi:COG1361 S-layer family protein [Palaeococcus ferrophilus]|uniref:COG1361 S-layer family protein n=1 Tax=Palaeococcus ferrophilus TaxID=83868 RepID=UPI00064F2EE7|nr:hypothetical protein [Palaeococcus ferrophilus]
MKKVLGFLTVLMVLSNVLGAVTAQEALLFEGYLDKGEAVFVGPLIVTLSDVQKDYLTNEYKAMLVVVKDGKPINANYTTINIPNPSKVQELLSNVTFLQAMAETLGYNTTNPLEYAQFLVWLSNAPQTEVWDAIVRTIQEHPELGISLEDLMVPMTFPEFTLIGENETIELDVDGDTVAITALEIYPNGAKLSISGPADWKASTLPAFIKTSVEAPKVANPGDEVTLRVHIKNEGALKVRYVNVVVSPMPVSMREASEGTASTLAQTLSQSGIAQNVFLPVNSSSQFIEYLEGKEERVLEFKVKVNENAEPGIYPLYVNVFYSIGTGGNLQMAQSVDYVALTVGRESDATFELLEIEKPDFVRPGEDFEVRVRLKNLGMDVAKNLLVKLEKGLTDVDSPFLIDNTTDQQYTSIVGTNREVEYTFRLHAKEDAKTGTYPLNIKLTYYSGDAKDGKDQTFEFSLSVVRKNSAFVEIEEVETSKDIEPGDEFTLRVRLRNVGEEAAKALYFKIEPQETEVQGEVSAVDLSSLQNLPVQGSQSMSENLQSALNQLLRELAKQNVEAFLPVGEDNAKYVGSLAPGEEATLEFRLRANEKLQNGVYPLKVSLTYTSEPDDSQVSDERLLGIAVTGRERLIVSKVSTSPSRVLAGTNNVEVSVEVENVGSGSARYVILKPMPSPPFELAETSEQLINLGSLTQGDSAKATFMVNVAGNATGGPYEIPVKIEYVDANGENRELELGIPVIVNEKPKIEIEDVRFDKTPLQGEDVTVYVELKNVGGEQAENVIIEGVVKADQPFTLVKRTDYIGDLDPGQSGEGALVISVARDALPKDYTVQVRIRAVGDKESGDDNVYVFEKSITIPVEENTRTEGNLKRAGLAVGILVVLVVIITALRRRR